MSDIQGRVLAGTLTAGMLAVAVLTGCAGGGAAGSGSSSGTTAGMAMSKGGGMFGAGKLQDALLTRINGAKPVLKPDAGSYATLPAVRAAATRMAKTTVIPKACAQSTAAQDALLDVATLRSAPAAFVYFHVGNNVVYEVLASPADAATATALGKPVPTDCYRYSTTLKGKRFQYAVRQDWVHGVGKAPARVVNISSVGEHVPGAWSLLYQGSGFVGAITVTGPDASEAAVHELGQQAYAYAAKVLR